MGREDWYRNSEWSPETAEAFWARFRRSRSSSSKAQYLRIQALYLERAGECEPALELLDYMIEHHPKKTEMASAELCRAKALAKLGRDSEAVEAFRAALRAEAELPNVQTGAALDFAEFAILRRRGDLYDEIEDTLDEFVTNAPLLLPVERFRVLAVAAILEQGRGNTSRASELATNALTVAAREHSGLRYHPKFGLVGKGQVPLLERLGEIAAV